MSRPRVLPLLLVPVVAMALAGCSGAGEAGDDEGIAIVASTNVYGSIAAAIGGDAVTVTSLIDSASQDPHSFEASARDRLAIEGAAIVIENGGGYDPFMDVLLDASSNAPIVLNASDIAQLPDGANEHLWYDLPAIETVADAIRDSLTELDPSGAEAYAANASAFGDDLAALETKAADLAVVADGRDIALTEPVPFSLLTLAGLVDATPPAFSEAIEEGADVAPRDLEAMLDLIDGGTVVLLAYNDQTTNAQTEQVRAAAEAAGIPVVSFTETLPDGLDYVQWMTANLDAIAAALG